MTGSCHISSLSFKCKVPSLFGNLGTVPQFHSPVLPTITDLKSLLIIFIYDIVVHVHFYISQYFDQMCEASTCTCQNDYAKVFELMHHIM